jgi:hypothetical protein
MTDQPQPEPAGSTRLNRNLKRLGILASAVLFVVALVVLTQILRDLEPGNVKAALAAASREQIGLALALTALSYLLLTGYDSLALWQLGQRIRYRVTALASYASYAVSFTLGFPLLTAGTVRYWIYSGEGLPARAIASLTLIAGVTFWLGMAVVLATALIARPEPISALNRFPASLNLLLGLLLLAGIGVYLVWVSLRRRAVALGGWRIEMPGFRVSIGQIALGAADVCAAGGVLYVLLPAGYAIPYDTFIAAYVFACLLGILSHAPGGLGVFEATILLALPAIPAEQLLGSLLLFRLCYYLLPFVLALLLLAAREIVIRRRALLSAINRESDARSDGLSGR